MTTAKTPVRHSSRAVLTRMAWAFASLTALWGALTVHGWSVWLIAFLLLPDLPLLAGGGPNLERGQLHPRAVPWYNATHHPLPALLAAALTWILLQPAVTIATMAALAWVAHIALDRSLGYGLRTRDGHQRQRDPVPLRGDRTRRVQAAQRRQKRPAAWVTARGSGSA